MIDSNESPFLVVQGNQLLYRGQSILLKGFNLEIFADNGDTIWRDYWNYRSKLRGLLDRARNMGSNTFRVIFPDNSLRLESDGSVPNQELDKLDDFLAGLAERGMGAIVTVFNRHNYATANRTTDARKVTSFVSRFGQDPRVIMWDIANEPTMDDSRSLTLEWLERMREAFDQANPAQPITIGADFHYALTWTDGIRRTMIDLSDVVSIHCYGRFKPGVTPVTDPSDNRVNYRDETFCGGTIHYIRNNTSKPILLEEFGWPDTDSGNWPPAHPWGIYNFPETPDSMDAMYREALNAIAAQGSVGAIQWTLQDAPNHFFGIVSADGTLKRQGNPNSAYEVFRAWGGAKVRQFSYNVSAPPKASKPVLDPSFYLALYADLQNAFGAQNYTAATQHWLDHGISEGRISSPAFDVRYYLGQYPDLQNAFGAQNYAAAVQHWLDYGIREGRVSSPVFDVRYYLGQYPDLQNAFGTNYAAAIQHWLDNGIREGRRGAAAFAPAYYLATYPDVAAAYGANNYRGAIIHWLVFGKNEGRRGAP